MSKTTNQSFDDSELSKGFHLLTESAHNVKVNTPLVPPNTAHLYPRLAGSDWTCYMSEPCIVLGRSGTVNPGQKRTRKNPIVHVDFEGSNLVSRRHCEIRFSARRGQWELYVYGRNGVKINHVEKKPRDKPTVLKTSSLIEINETIFVFILPENFIPPRHPSQRGDSEITTTPNEHNDPAIDHELEATIISLFADQTQLDTKDILIKLKKSNSKSMEKETLLHLLVISPRFHLAHNSIAMSSKESDHAKWTLIPSISTTTNAITLNKEKEPVAIDSTCTDTNEYDEPSNLPPALLPSVASSCLFNDDIDDGDWSVFMPDSPLDQPTESSDKPDAAAAAAAAAALNLKQSDELEQSSSFEAPSPEETGSLEWENTATKDVSRPLHPLSPENYYAVDQLVSPTNAPPALFKGLSIKSMYSLWTSSTSSLLEFQDESIDESCLNKRLKQTNSDGSSGSINKTGHPKETNAINTDIYREIHTKIIM